MNLKKTKEILRRLDITPSRRKSQHFLIDDGMAEWQVEQADIKVGEKVLEIGPGIGVLTEHLLSKTGNLTAIESDSRLAKYLEEEYGIEVICADVLDVKLPEFDKVISNLPYHISSEVTRLLLGQQFSKAVLMYQKEFAGHLVANPGSRDYSRLTVMVKYFSDATVIRDVPKESFYPTPKVDSAVVELTPHPPLFIPRDEGFYFDIVRLLFSHKNRKVRNALLSEYRWFSQSKDVVFEWVDHLPFADERPVKLSPEEINDICNAIRDLKINYH